MGRIMATKLPTSGTPGCVTSQSRRGFVDVVKVKDPKMGRWSWIAQCPSLNS